MENLEFESIYVKMPVNSKIDDSISKAYRNELFLRAKDEICYK